MTVEKVYVPVGRERGVSLYEINQGIEDALFSLADPETGEIDEEKEREIESLKMSRVEKILNCIRFQKNMLNNKLVYDDEVKRLKEKSDWFKKRSDKMLAYIDGMTDRKKDAGVGDVAGSLKWTKSTKAIIEDPTKLPVSLCEMVRKPVAKDIKAELLKEAELIAAMGDAQKEAHVSKFKGAAHLQVGYSLKIK